MKVGFVPLYNIQGPSSRYRVFQFVEPLSRHGFVCSVLEAPEGDNRKRLSYPARLFVLALQSDVLYIQKRTFPGWVSLTLKRINPHIIFDLDDAIYLQSWNTHKVKELIQLSTAVVAGNQVLADYAQQYNTNVCIIHSVVDTSLYLPPAVKRHPNDGRTILGWIGSDPNRGDLNLIEPVLDWLGNRFGSKIVLRIVGKRPLEIQSSLDIEFVNWTLENSRYELQKFDIGIMPLYDTHWNLGKCGLKLIQYMAVSAPAIASPIGINNIIVRDGINGFLATDITQWQYYLAYLIENQHIRTRMGKAARKHVEQNYSIDAVLPSMIAVLNEVATHKNKLA